MTDLRNGLTTERVMVLCTEAGGVEVHAVHEHGRRVATLSRRPTDPPIAELVARWEAGQGVGREHRLAGPGRVTMWAMA